MDIRSVFQRENEASLTRLFVITCSWETFQVNLFRAPCRANWALLVSRRPVHDKLRQLTKGELVLRTRSWPHHDDDIEIFELRRFLDGPTAEIVAGRLDAQRRSQRLPSHSKLIKRGENGTSQ